MFGSGWPQQNQQQQPQQTGAFGQPTGFGTATNNNGELSSLTHQTRLKTPTELSVQQVLLVSPSNSNLRLTQCLEILELLVPVRDLLFLAIKATHSFSGAFGATNNTNTSAFGVKPATGFGAFSGGTGAFGSGTTTSTFGQPVNSQASTSTSVFGQPANANTTSAFGSFGKTFGGEHLRVLSCRVALIDSFQGATATAAPPVVTTGTSNPPYSVTTEKDQNVTLQFNAISCMPQYAGYSAEVSSSPSCF